MIGPVTTTTTTFVALLVLAAQAFAESKASDDETKLAIETFTGPVRIESRAPSYPMSYRRDGREGWVSLNFMIDPTGKPYDVAVHNSSGDALFDKAAAKAIEGFRYNPAVFEGRAIDASSSVTITFALKGQTGARSAFVSKYKQFSEAITEEDQDRASERLAGLTKRDRNLYEEAFYQLALYQYARLWGDIGTQYAAISRAAFLDKGQGYLPAKTLTSVLSTKMKLELTLNKLAYARHTAKQLSVRRIPQAFAAKLEDILASIDEVAASDQQLAVPARIRGDNSFAHRLFRSSFELRDIDGDVAELRLHCDKGYLGFIYQEGMNYQINPAWRGCVVIVIGNPGTTFDLVET